MLLVYREAYSELLGAWRERGRLFSPSARYKRGQSWIAFVDDFVKDVETRLSVRIRPDGRLLLVSNFATMVAEPLMLGGRLDREQIADIVRSDIEWLIVEGIARGEERRLPRDQDGLSAHVLLDALAGKWTELKTNASELWD